MSANSVGILMIHGTFGSPNEFHKLETALQAQGIQTHLLCLPGHGDAPDCRLDTVNGQALLDYCRNEYQVLSQSCDAIFLMGHSLGGILSLLLAAEHPPNLQGVITFGTPYEHAYTVNYFVGWLKFPVSHLFHGLRYAPKSYTGYKAPVFLPWWFPKLQREAMQLLALLQESLSKITTPVLLAHSPYDMIIPYAEMDKIAGGMSLSRQVTTHRLQHCGHQVFPNSREEAACTELILNFIVKQVM